MNCKMIFPRRVSVPFRSYVIGASQGQFLSNLSKGTRTFVTLRSSNTTNFNSPSQFSLNKGGIKACTCGSSENKLGIIKLCKKSGFQAPRRHFGGAAPNEVNDAANYLEATDDETFEILSKDFLIYEDFITPEEEDSLFQEVEPHLKRMIYEESHWDDAIHGYRETEKKKWRERNQRVLQRVRDLAFPPGTPQLAYVHVLDLKDSGVIKAHIDSVKFCGHTIAGLSLLSPSVMRLVCDEDKTKYGDAMLNQRSLYIMRHRARYEYTHEVLGPEASSFRGKKVEKGRRISVICRNEPET